MSLPALLGGTPMRPQGPPAWPPPDPEILEVLQQAFRDGWWGKYDAGRCDHLTELLRDFHQVEHVILCGSGNYAVELGLRALQIDSGDEVILADYDYPGNFFSIHAVGATPVLVDVEPESWQISLDAVRQAIGPKTKAILASHLHGGRVADELLTLAREKGLAVLEDAAQATGAVLSARRAGTLGDVGVLSFGGSKLLSAGRGGALLTRNPGTAQRARNHLLRAGNIVCPMTELQAALLGPQLKKLDERNQQRRSNVTLLCDSLAGLSGLHPFVRGNESDCRAFYKLGIQFDEAKFGLSRERTVKAMRAEGFAVDEGFEAAHRTRSPKRYRQGSALDEADRAHTGCVQVHHPILLEPTVWIRDFAEALRRIQQHAELLASP